MGSLTVHQLSSFCRIRQLHGCFSTCVHWVAEQPISQETSLLEWKNSAPVSERLERKNEENYQQCRFYIMHAYDQLHFCNRWHRFSWRGGFWREMEGPPISLCRISIYLYTWLNNPKQEKKKSKESLGEMAAQKNRKARWSKNLMTLLKSKPTRHLWVRGCVLYNPSLQNTAGKMETEKKRKREGKGWC